MRIEELAKEIELTEEELKSNFLERRFTVTSYFDGEEPEVENECIVSSLEIAGGEIVAASYYTLNYVNNSAGDSLEDDVDGVIQLWIKTFGLE